MELKVVLLFALVAVIGAAPAKKGEIDDLAVAEGRSLPSYAAPNAYAAPAAPRHVGGTVTSYNRRGSYAQASEFAKPSIYGSSYGAPHATVRAPAYAPEPVGYAPAQRYPAPELAYPVHQGYGDYGPEVNEYSAQSQQHSHDPSYDPAKDPVSQYAAYVPVREYGPKAHSDGKELSLYGYK